jgi:hypothetical protein
VVIQIEGASYRLRQHADLVPEVMRPKPPSSPAGEAPRRRGRPPRAVSGLAESGFPWEAE